MKESEMVNELRPELLGLHALNPLAYTNSASRSCMFASHFTQHLVTNGMQERILYSGLEQEMAKYTLGIRMPANGKIIEVIPRYPPGVGQGSIAMNPEFLVVYENQETGEIDCFNVPMYRSFHQYFGWPCVPKEGMEQLRPGANIRKDTVFVDTPGVKDGNSYMCGRNVPVAYMSIPSVSEDGIAVERKELENWKYRLYDVRSVSWGRDHFPVNIYGKDKPFPDIGEMVHESGLLMALRPYDPDMFAIDMSNANMEKLDYVFDKQTYARPGKGRVIDIEILSNNLPIRNTPLGMSAHADKYVRALQRYYQTVIQVEERLRYERKKKYGVANLNISPRFNKVLVRAMAITNHHAERIKQNLTLIHRKEKIDEYFAKFVIEYEFTPGMGDKLSNYSGSKGVICKIMEDHEMPIRPDGLRAKMIIDSSPIFHRMNLGQSYEQFMTCAAYDVTIRITHQLGLIPSLLVTDFENRPEVDTDAILSLDPDRVAQVYDYLMEFYRVFNDVMPNFFGKLSREGQAEHLADIVNEGICTIYLPVDNPKLPKQIVRELRQRFNPTFTPVKYVDQSGQQVTTKKAVRIGFVYMLLLDKIASEWSATSAARLQHFGILSSVTKSEKFAYPYRNSPTRLSGETESRIFAGYSGQESIAEMFDRTNNPVTRRNIYWNLLDAENPSQIDQIVDRDIVPLGASRPIQIVNHVFMCAGFKPVYQPENHDYVRTSSSP